MAEVYSGNGRSLKLFGFEIKRAETEDPKKRPSIVPARDDDGAGYVTAVSYTHLTLPTTPYV